MGARNISYSEEVRLVTEQCCNCNVLFAMPQSLKDCRLKDHANFYCPNGHPQIYTGKSDAEKLRDELTKEKQRREMAEREAGMEKQRAVIATLELERIQKRVKHGVCPCCKRTFQNVARHMKTKHPEAA